MVVGMRGREGMRRRRLTRLVAMGVVMVTENDGFGAELERIIEVVAVFVSTYCIVE